MVNNSDRMTTGFPVPPFLRWEEMCVGGIDSFDSAWNILLLVYNSLGTYNNNTKGKSSLSAEWVDDWFVNCILKEEEERKGIDLEIASVDGQRAPCLSDGVHLSRKHDRIWEQKIYK